MTEKKIKDAAASTPDPERSLKNLSSFISENPSRSDELEGHIRSVSMLFSFSQFLANYCISNPDMLFRTLEDIDVPRDKDALSSLLKERLKGIAPAYRPSRSLDPYMTAVREFKMEEILRITFRDILKRADLVDIMLELSFLADVIIDESLRIVREHMEDIYGRPADDAFCVISLGKLGGEELNFSSDVDLIFVYGPEPAEATGVRTDHGVTVNRISNREYYSKVGETLTRFLSLNTGSGFTYRVDLRLRPDGQRGDIAMSLRGYEMYYESWGKAWERAMLIRARPCAGDLGLGNDFLEMIRPFVYRKYLDFSSLDEIRRLKRRIDATFKPSDIKRGYGGIREVEFFAQALQLIYGGREPLLRERSTLKVLHRLLQKGLIGQSDYFVLADNYRRLRTLEHRLQQLNDLQTHMVPAGEAELSALGRKMGFSGAVAFTADLQARRSAVRSIYDSLFADRKEAAPVSGTFFDEELSDGELREYLSTTGIIDADKAVRNIKAIKDSTFSFQTLRGRRLLSEILPDFIESALKSGSPDAVLTHLHTFARLLSANESYLEIFSRNRGLIDLLTYVFSQSEYLTKMILSRPEYLEMIGWGEFARKSLSLLQSEIKAGISEGRSVNDATRLTRQAEEIRLGLLFLRKEIGVGEVTRGLSKAAEAILSVSMKKVPEGAGDMAAIGFGKLGGREITFGSDLDVIFVTPYEVAEPNTKAAERLLRMLISYTREGIAYRVDTRLRPEGSKGPLVSSVESLRKYYKASAAFWEFQALLKARPVAGDTKTGMQFLDLARETLISRGREVSASDIRQMRERILRELSKEQEGYDIKLGPGGIEEIEFTIQYLQLINCGRFNRLLVQSTLNAADRLGPAGILDKNDVRSLKETYIFYRTLESFLRLRGENVLKKDEGKLRNAAGFMGFEKTEEFVESVESRRKTAREISERYLGA